MAQEPCYCPAEYETTRLLFIDMGLALGKLVISMLRNPIRGSLNWGLIPNTPTLFLNIDIVNLVIFGDTQDFLVNLVNLRQRFILLR